MGGVVVPCPAGTYGPKVGLQRLRECTVCPAGRALIDSGKSFKPVTLTDTHCISIKNHKLRQLQFFKPNRPILVGNISMSFVV